MMLILFVALLVFAAPLLFGIYLMSKMRFLNTWLEAAALGVPAGIALFTAFLFMLYAIAGFLSMLIIYMSLAVFFIPVIIDIAFSIGKKSTSAEAKASAKRQRLKPYGLNPNLMITIFILSVIISSIFVFSISKGGNTVYCIDAGCSDTLYHVGMGNSLIYLPFPPKYLFTVGTINVYPFMNDFFSMLLNSLGFGLVASILIPDILLIFSFVTLSIMFAYRVTKSVGATIASAVIFWFGGNGLMKLIDFPFAGYLSKFMQPIHLIPIEFAVMPHATTLQFASSLLRMSAIPITYWTTIINNMLIAQHDFMLGLPIGIALLYLLYMFVFENGKSAKFGARELVLIGILAGLLPLIHPTTLLVLLVVGAFFFIYTIAIKEKRAYLPKWLYIVIMLLVAVPELYYMNMQHRSANWFFPNYGGFIIQAHASALTFLYTFANIAFFWIEAASLPIIFGFVALLFVKRDLRLLFVPFFVLLAMITLYSPLPNPSDSNKIFLYIFLVFSIFTGMLVERIYRHKNAVLKVAAIIIVLLITFNFASVYINDITQGTQILVSSAQMSAANFILYNTPPNAVFAENSYNSFFNPIVSTIGSRVTLISYNVYVGGIYKYNPSILNAYNNNIFSTGSCRLIRQFNISYIYLQTPNLTAASVFSNVNFSDVYNIHDSQKSQYISIYKTNCS